MAARLLTLAAAALLLPAADAVAARDKDDGIVVQDLAYGEVLFEFFQEDYFTALTRLLAAQQRGELAHHGVEAELMLGGLYLSYGQHRLAGEIFERVLQQSVEPALHDRAWFFLAKIWQQRGYLGEAEAALARITDELPKELESERQMLYAQVLMDQGRFADALTSLEQWREQGKAPTSILATHSTNGKVDRTRPLCPYPQVAKYKGNGSIDKAENFVCAQ